MAVYTQLEEQALKHFLDAYDLGSLLHVEGIEEGIENSNFRLETTEGRFILTLFERRVNPADLPWFMGLMTHLAHNGIICPQPVMGRDGAALRVLQGRPAVVVTFLSGRPLSVITSKVCAMLGRFLAQFHQAGQGFTIKRANTLGPQGWKALLARCTSGGDEAVSGLMQEASAALESVIARWPVDDALPHGQIHADLFPDNLFFQDGHVSGVIDFYFACTDFLAYDLAICLNAWCFDDEAVFQPDHAHALLTGYDSVRPLTEAERTCLPVLCQGAALRFLLTRLYDWVNTPVGALVARKDPWVYQRRLAYFREYTCVG